MLVILLIQLLNGYIMVQSIALIKEELSLDKFLVCLVSSTMFYYLSTLVFKEHLWEVLLFDTIFIITVIYKDIPLHEWVLKRWKLYSLLLFNLLLLIII